MSVEQAFNFKKIDERVATSGLLNEAQLAELSAAGYETVINLLPVENEYAIKNEADIVKEQGLEYQYIPVDYAAPQARDFDEFVQAMEASKDKKILIHCAANYRVSAFYAIYAHQKLGWTSSQAREHIASIWSPAEYPPWELFIAEYLGADT